MAQMLAEISQPERPRSPLSNIYAWAHLSRLFNRSWFERLWVIQELGVSQEALLLCGGIEISWVTIEDAAAFILRPDPATPAAIQKFLPLMGAHRVTQVALKSVSGIDRGNLLTVLRQTQGANCSDPRDKLYAVLGVVEDTQDIEIDYSKLVEIVYRDWAIKRILRIKKLDILSACADSGRVPGLPSWVPDLRRPWAIDKALWRITVEQRQQDLVRISPDDMPWTHKTVFREHGSQLALVGSFIEEIVSLSSVGDAVSNLNDPADLTNRLLEIIIAWETWFRQKIPSNNVWAVSEYGFRHSLLRVSHIHGTVADIFAQYGRWRDPSSQRQFSSAESWRITGRRAFERQLFSFLHGCQMFVTKRGNSGMVAGNCNTQIGDQISFLSGGLTPSILRRSSDSRVKFRLISPCFLNYHMTDQHTSPTPLFSTRDLSLQTVVLV